jgi:hypothetical protein
MIISINGALGSGKTLMLTYLAYSYYKAGYAIYSNYHLNFKYEPINVKESFDYSNCFIAFDELHTYFDSRQSTKKSNRIFSYFILQTRKRNVVLGYTAQLHGSVDKRIRAVEDFNVFCEKKPDGIMYYITDGIKAKTLFLPNSKIPIIGKLYDTNQIIQPVE